MARIFAVGFLTLLGGCAAYRVPDRIIPTDWAVVRALPPGTRVGIYIDDQDVRDGTIELVADETLILRTASGNDALSRAAIRQIALRTSTGTTRAPNIAKTAVGGAALGGAVALVMANVDENGSARGQEWGVFLTSSLAGAALGALREPKETVRERLVYIRPYRPPANR